ncbi:S-layer homology domain-containing protein [Sporosarcina sp. FSL W8-0480]|uniref:S-layer homology domain-containing protein n=1 Tax=Sporosarcina sp. FSL W8-0480 TaxID=2954701 RepID=UPI0030D95A68
MLRTKKMFLSAIASSMVVCVVMAPAVVHADGASFSDLDVEAHYYDSVIELSKRGIVNGFPDGTFRPGEHVTRGQAAAMLASALGIDTDNVNNPNFTDLPTTHAFYMEIAALVQAGVVGGYTDGTFKPNAFMTRAQIAKIIHDGFGLSGDSLKETPFLDISADDWFAPYVESLRLNGITSGTSPTTYSPNSFVTRGQFASFITRSEAAVSVLNFAGNGRFDLVNGKRESASFRGPNGIAFLPDGSLLVADSRNHVIRKIFKGDISTFAGMTLDINEFGLPQGAFYNGDKEAAFFDEPFDIAVDAVGDIFIVDSKNHAIRKISPNGQVTTLAGGGFIGKDDGFGENALFYSPRAIAVAENGTVYVADTLNHLIRKITTDGKVTTLNAASERVIEVASGEVEWVGDHQDGLLKDAKFNEPSGLALDSKGNLYVSDSGNQVIRYIDFSTNTVSTVAGVFRGYSIDGLYAGGDYSDGLAESSRFNFPKGLAYSNENGLFIADSVNKSIRVLKDGKVRTIARGFKSPTGIAVDTEGNLHVVDSYDNRVLRILSKGGM